MTIEVTNETFDKEVLESEVPVLVDLWAPWCGPCKAISPVVDELAKQYDGKLKVVKVNVDEEPELAVDLGVKSIPTFFMVKGGFPVDIMMGASKDKLEAFIKKHL